MSSLPLLRPGRLQSLATGILREKPGLTSRELYIRLCQTPTVVAFREQKFPRHEPPAASERSLAETLTTPSKRKQKGNTTANAGPAQTNSSISESTIAPTRSFFQDHVIKPLLQQGRIHQKHKLIKSTSEEAAKLPENVIQRAHQARRSGPPRIDVWQLYLTPPPSPRVVPRAPKALSLNPISELEIRRKAGEFDHLNRRKKRLIMRRCEGEIRERQESIRKEWREAVAKAKKDEGGGRFDIHGWEKGKGLYGRTIFPEPPKPPREPLKGIWATPETTTMAPPNST